MTSRRSYCRCCGDILDTDPAAGNARPGDTYCYDCCVHIDDERDAEQAVIDQQTHEHDQVGAR